MPEVSPTKYRVEATWSDCPHLSKQEKDDVWDSIPVHQRDARAKGIPQLGAGAIFPLDEERIKCEPFKIPEFWPVAFALDVGWNNTACVWGAWDRDSNTVYIWSEYKQGQAEPATHVDAIKSRGDWIPGVIDPAARGRSQKDGVKLLDEYENMGLDLDLADNAVESGLHAVYRRMVGAGLKIFSTCPMFFDEFRLYRRDEKGKVVKDNDHIMDCTRYLIASGMARAVTKLEAYDFEEQSSTAVGNATTGY